MRRRRTGKSTPKLREVELEIEQLGFRGDGRACHEGHDVAVPLTLPGERWLVALEQGPGRVWQGRAIEALKLVDRPDPICQHFGLCGGCALQHLSSDEYDAIKRRRIATALENREIAAPSIAPTSKSPLASRRRLRLAFNGQGALGLRQRNARHVVPMLECPITVPAIVAALPALGRWTRKLGGAGELSVTASGAGLELLLIGPDRPDGHRIDEARAEGWARLAYVAEVNDHPEILMLAAEPWITLAQNRIALPPAAFLQATTQGETALQQFTIDQLAGHRRVADFFCGLGTLTLALAEQGHEVQAFDVHEASVRALRASNRVSRAESVDLWRQPPEPHQLARLDAVVIDPPRAGAETLCRNLTASKVNRIVYASCDPKSFARDAAILTAAGFTLQALQPIDQFLFSAEIELIAAFTRG